MEITAAIRKKLLQFITKRNILILVLLFAVYAILTRGAADTNQIQTAKIGQKNLTATVIASGIVKSQNESSLHFAVSGKLTWIGPKEGDTVEKGQKIAQIDPEKYQIAQRQAEQDVIAADAILEQTYNNIHINGVENYDQRVQRTDAEADKNKAFDAQKAAQRALRDTTLFSPISGKVFEISPNVGEEVFATTEIAKIGQTGDLEFLAEVDETDIPKIKEGQKTTINLDAFENQPLTAIIKIISEGSITTSTGATAYQVKMDMPESAGYKSGMNGEAQIEVNQSENVLSAPIEAIIDEKFVWKKEKGEYKQVEIQIGLETDSEVEVVKGLENGDEIVTSGFEQINKKSLLQKIIGAIR